MKRLIICFMIFAWWAFLVCPQAIAAEAPKPAVKAAPNVLVSKEAPKPAVKAAPKVLVSKEEVQEKIKMVTKTISGEVSTRGPSGVAVVYEKDEVKGSSHEMWFPYEAEVKLTGYETKADIGEGDLVTVTYDQAEDGSKRMLTGIRLDKKAPKKEELPPEEEEESNE